MSRALLVIGAMFFSSYCMAQTNTFPTSGNVGIGTTNPENVDGWDKVLEVRGTSHSKFMLTSNNVKSGLWSHDLGYYGTLPGGFVGTISTHPFSFITAGSPKMIVTVDGSVGIGTLTPTEKLSVKGKIRAQEIKVENANWPDFVFAKSFALPTLKETETHIKEKGHLPGIPSAAEVKANGVDLGDMNAKLLQKIEELTLYIIDLEKRMKKVEDK